MPRLSLILFLLSGLQLARPNVEAQGANLSVAPAPAQNSTSAESTQDVTTLEAGKTVALETSGGKIQGYQIKLSAGQFASVTVQQRGINVIEELFAPDGKLIAEFDSELRPQEEERADFVAETAGAYRLDVKAKIKGVSGRYEIQLTEVRAATDHDRQLHEAHKLSTQALNLYAAGKLDEAVPPLTRALELNEKELGREHVYVAYLLDLSGQLYFAKGNYAQAEQLFQRALAIDKKMLGLAHPQTAGALADLGVVYNRTNKYAEAEELLQQALTLTEQTLGAEHPRVVRVLRDISALHYRRGDMVRAEQELQRALKIADKTLEPDDFQLVQVLNNLGLLYVSNKEYDRAEPLLQRALEIAEKKFGPESSQLSLTLQNLGLIAQEQKKDYARALELYWRAEKNLEKSVGPEHPNVAAILNNIANIYKSRSEYAKALELHLRVHGMCEKALGAYNGNTLISLGNIATTYAAMGDVANAIKFQTLTDEAVEKNLTLNLAIGSERQKLAYFDSLANRTDRTVSLHVTLAPHDPSARDLAAQVILQRKGRVLDAMSGSLAALRQRLNVEDQALLDQLNTATAQLAKLALNGPQKMDAAEYQKQIKALEDQNEQLEAEISRRSAEFRAQSQTVTLKAVQAAIPSNAALIEFATYRPFNPKAEDNEQYGKPRYAAYVIRNQGEVQWKELGEAQAIDADVDKLRQALRDPKRNDVRDLARTVDEKVMRSIRALVGDATQLLVSPDGELNLIPFAALVDEEGRYLVERYSFTYLTSGRDLLRMQVARDGKGKPLIVANPSFGEPDAPNIRRESVTAARVLSEVYFAPLGGTEQEARSIQTLFPEASLLTGADATESAVKGVAAPRILHIATHGFFLADAGSPAGGNPPGAARGTGASSGIGNPLLRSGLALAGANRRGSGEGDNGILTALEASGLNLWGTELAVLSACDTGVGEVRNGEGVYGLRRAFVLAGAESMVMSLWPVSDYSTRRSMANYYHNLKQGLGRGASLREVQLHLLKSNPQLHPFYWANFIQSGEWANLDGKR
ncbi:MAG: hypothetical protein DLM73_08190 [Chthoniobacterales bacterium]|nr:MAG: hypothetical protein DLM73_08190 [Chthoniobacterales bacterium]